MKKTNLQNFEYGFLLLIFLIIFQQLLLFLQMGSSKTFTIDFFLIAYVGLLGIVLGYFFGFKLSIPYSIFFVTLFSLYIIIGKYDITFFHYIWFLFVPFSSIVSSFLYLNRLNLYKDTNKLLLLENQMFKTDVMTKMLTDYAFFDILSKHAALAYRYESFFFITMLVRIEFISTIKYNLTKETFENLLSDISKIIRSNLRIEDYKFFIEDEKFIVILPMTYEKQVNIVKDRIISKINTLEIYDKNARRISLIIKIGILEYNKEDNDSYLDIQKILLKLEKKSEEDIYAEYKK